MNARGAGLPRETAKTESTGLLIRLAQNSVRQLSVVFLQDVLG